MREMTCGAELHELDRVLRWVKTCCADAGFDEKRSGEVELALEEVVTNIIYYAYWGEKGEISLSAQVTPDGLEFIVKDRGVPFNPLAQRPPVDPAAPLDDREEGGLGIFFVSQLMDSVQYERLEPFNILTLTKNIL